MESNGPRKQVLDTCEEIGAVTQPEKAPTSPFLDNRAPLAAHASLLGVDLRIIDSDDPRVVDRRARAVAIRVQEHNIENMPLCRREATDALLDRPSTSADSRSAPRGR